MHLSIDEEEQINDISHHKAEINHVICCTSFNLQQSTWWESRRSRHKVHGKIVVLLMFAVHCVFFHRTSYNAMSCSFITPPPQTRASSRWTMQCISTVICFFFTTNLSLKNCNNISVFPLCTTPYNGGLRGSMEQLANRWSQVLCYWQYLAVHG